MLKDYHQLDNWTAMSTHQLTPGSTFSMFWPISSVQSGHLHHLASCNPTTLHPCFCFRSPNVGGLINSSIVIFSVLACLLNSHRTSNPPCENWALGYNHHLRVGDKACGFSQLASGCIHLSSGCSMLIFRTILSCYHCLLNK